MSSCVPLDAELNCPVCYQISGGNIFQCVNGHILCDLCSNIIETCPQCRESMRADTRGRNIFMEKILDTLDFDCPFSGNGCKIKNMKRDVLAKHRALCIHGKFVCICANLEPNDCDFVITHTNIKEAVTHLEDIHGKKHDNITYIGVPHPYILRRLFGPTSFNGAVAVCSHMINLENELDGNVSISNILFIARIDGDTLSWFFFQLSEDTSETGLQGEISSCEDPQLSWVVPVAHLLDADRHFKDPNNRTSIVGLKERRKKTINVTPIGGDRNSFNINIKIMKAANM